MPFLPLARVVDPNFAATSLTLGMVDELATIKPLANLELNSELKRELPKYLSACASFPAIDHEDVHAFTSAILGFWKMNAPLFPAWAKTARIFFAMSPSSASCERVFSLLDSMFGMDQITALGDMVQGAVMLRYHKRLIG